MNAYLKDIIREIKKTAGRFFSLLIIASLGAMAVIGIQATSIDMRAVADKTYKEQNLYDIQLKSTTGFDSEDITAIKNLTEVHTLMPTYILDVYIYFENETNTVRTYALPDGLNKITLVDGRLPQNAEECVVERRLLRYGRYNIGDTIKLGLDSMDDYYNILENDVFTIVGIVNSPFYISFERGHTSLGDGKLNYYLYLHPEAYKLDIYTDVYVLMEGSREMDNLTDKYYETADEWKDQIKLIGDFRVQEKVREFADAQIEINDGWKKYYDGIDELNEKIAEGQKEFEDAEIKLENAKSVLETGQKQIDEGREILEQNLAELNLLGPQGFSSELDKYYEQIYSSIQKLDANEEEINDGWTEYYKGLEEYNDGVKKLETEEADARVKLAEAKTELEEAEEKLDSAPIPEWFYFTRKDGVAFDSYYQDTLRLQSIGYVFPMMFFLVAVLVSLTTMSRMVEEHRTQIGIYKALGYRPFNIIMKYLIYSFSASVIGGLLGIITGSNIFPRIIADAYNHLYEMPPIETPIPVLISFIAVALSVVVVVSVTLITCMKSMTDTPATLMRPISPPEGKRVLLERISFIWNRLGFLSKVTARNIFRYKKRFIMTLIGISGCTALLLTAFGLRDSVGSVGTLQYEKIIAYNSRVYLKEIKYTEQRSEIDSLLSGSYIYIREESVTTKTQNKNFTASVIIPEETETFSEYINLCSRKTGNNVTLSPDGVLVTEKLAREIGAGAGGSIVLTSSSGKIYTVQVTGVVENYIQHFIYMPPNIYCDLFGAEPLYNSIFIITENPRVFADTLLKNDNVRAFINTDDIKGSINESTDALRIVTVVLIVLACTLAFVVLFNLTNINITERIRELATIKVLGFYDIELALYVYRENGVVTALGIILGILAGIPLLGFILTSAELDILMFPHIIKLHSYIYAVVLSVVFAVFVNIVMNYKLAKIDMVESLKSVE